MSDELEEGLLEVQNLIHRQVKQIDDFIAICNNPSEFNKHEIRLYITRLFEIAKDFYMNLESMYISSESQTRQIDAIKDAIFSLSEVRNSRALQDRFNELFASHTEGMKQMHKSFMKTYGIEEV